MKVCLISPMLSGEYINSEIYENLGLAYISSYLSEKGIYNKILDLNVTNLSMKELMSFIDENKFDAVGISSYNSNYRNTLQIVQKLKNTEMKPVVFLGGYLPTLAHELIKPLLKDVLCFVIGEGEITVFELLSALKNGESWHEIHGLMFQDENGEIVTTRKRELISDLDKLPSPKRYHFNPTVFGVCLMASRGCGHNCAFCATPAFTKTCEGARLRMRSPDNVIAEMEELITKTGISELTFFDENLCFGAMSRKSTN